MPTQTWPLRDAQETQLRSSTVERMPPCLFFFPFLNSALDLVLDLVLDLLHDALVLQALAVHEDAGALDDADDAEEEVDGGEEVVLGGDDEAPARPDQAGGRQGAVLLQGEVLGGAGEVGHAGEDEGPLGFSGISVSIYVVFLVCRVLPSLLLPLPKGKYPRNPGRDAREREREGIGKEIREER